MQTRFSILSEDAYLSEDFRTALVVSELSSKCKDAVMFSVRCSQGNNAAFVGVSDHGCRPPNLQTPFTAERLSLDAVQNSSSVTHCFCELCLQKKLNPCFLAFALQINIF